MSKIIAVLLALFEVFKYMVSLLSYFASFKAFLAGYTLDAIYFLIVGYIISISIESNKKEVQKPKKPKCCGGRCK